MRRTIRDIFFAHQAQTTAQPIGLEVKKARGSYIIDKDNKKYLDFVAMDKNKITRWNDMCVCLAFFIKKKIDSEARLKPNKEF